MLQKASSENMKQFVEDHKGVLFNLRTQLSLIWIPILLYALISAPEILFFLIGGLLQTIFILKKS